MEEIVRIISPSSASWVVWLLLMLLCLVAMNRSLLLSIPTLWHSLSSYSERMYTGGRTQTVMNAVMSVVFRLTVMALCIYVMHCRVDFLLGSFAKILAIVTAVYAVQWSLWKIVGYTFLSPAQRENASEQRTMIYNAACVILLLLLLPMIHITNPVWLYILAGVFVLLLLLMLLFRGLQMFGHGLTNWLYVFLYIITLELLPLLGMTIWAKQII